MEVDGLGNTPVGPIRNVRRRLASSDDGIATASGTAGGLHLSARAEEVRIASQALRQLPDPRPDRVRLLNSEIAEGRYIVDPEKIAERMLGMFLPSD